MLPREASELIAFRPGGIIFLIENMDAFNRFHSAGKADAGFQIVEGCNARVELRNLASYRRHDSRCRRADQSVEPDYVRIRLRSTSSGQTVPL